MEKCFVAPQTPAEQALAAIWKEVLRVETIGIHDNFFELGGHSLLATQVTSRIHAVFKKNVSLLELFQKPTLAALGALIDSMAQGQAPMIDLGPIQRVTREEKPPFHSPSSGCGSWINSSRTALFIFYSKASASAELWMRKCLNAV